MLQARQGEGESTPDDILAMVKAQAAPSHRCAIPSRIPFQAPHVHPSQVGPVQHNAAASTSLFRQVWPADHLCCKIGNWPAQKILGATGGCLCRLILFLQQSSVEWASSLWMHVVQELDPEFKRTVEPLSCACTVIWAHTVESSLSPGSYNLVGKKDRARMHVWHGRVACVRACSRQSTMTRHWVILP